ncbi:OLC1v1023816C1 [Oldenlandia corymbosa var. corymbosa]|uniref:OLC1v1023816C1 n=1 Tax=Oldenlandia corymbosa var. corymbosa TaxID=529605 RepID=A0AAV1C0T9_OLDCO|nr:OLC1v1023816C1 [Oldenlandia corymbosa var. corymbosa]
MEAIVLKVELDDNKENINPLPSTQFSSNKVTNGGFPLLEMPKSKNPIADRKPIRRPLQDITHLFVDSRAPVLRFSSPSGCRFQSSAIPVAECRKRKLADAGVGFDSMRKNAGKILRTGFR